MGARRVVVGEGPGHQRDTELVVHASGLEPQLADRAIEFIDLNRDEVRKVRLKADYSGLRELWLPRTVLLNFCFFVRCDDFLCRLREVMQLIEASPGDSENSHKGGPSGFCDLITVGVWDLVNEPMGPQHAEFPADGSGAPSPLRWNLRRCAVE